MNKNLMVGIISYMPQHDPELKEERIKEHHNQLDWLTQVWKDVKILIVAQNYQNRDYYIHENVEYIKKEAGIGVSPARNHLLRYFYGSGYDWIYLLDDDNRVYDYFEPSQFMLDIAANPKKFFELDFISPVYPQLEPFKKLIAENWKTHNEYYVFHRIARSFIHGVYLKNIKKHYDDTLYFKCEFNREAGSSGEDFVFVYDLIVKGYIVVGNKSIIAKNRLMNKSSIFPTFDDRLVHHRRFQDQLVEHFSEYGMKKGKKHINTSEMMKRYNKTEKEYRIKRPTPIEVFDTPALSKDFDKKEIKSKPEQKRLF